MVDSRKWSLVWVEKNKRLGQCPTSFSKTTKPVIKYWASRNNVIDAARAFRDYTTILTNWRHAPYFDPGLPKEFLPKSWAGYQATENFFELHDKLAGPALNFALNIAKK